MALFSYITHKNSIVHITQRIYRMKEDGLNFPMYTTKVGNFYNISSRHRHLKYTRKKKERKVCRPIIVHADIWQSIAICVCKGVQWQRKQHYRTCLKSRKSSLLCQILNIRCVSICPYWILWIFASSQIHVEKRDLLYIIRNTFCK